MIYKKLTSLLSVKMIPIISKYVNHHTSCSTCIICDNNQNKSMNSNQQVITPFELISLWFFVKVKSVVHVKISNKRVIKRLILFYKTYITLITNITEENEVKDDMMSMVKYLVRHQGQFHACVANTSEASFTEKYIMPVIRRVLLQDASRDLLYAMIDKPITDGKKPDFMIGTKVKKQELYFFFVEVKRPETTSKYQPEDDYAKLMEQMKRSVDDQLCLGVQTPLSLGLLVEGFDCTLFQTMLLSDGLYEPMAINRFSLIEQSYHHVLLPSIVEAFYYVKCELNKFVVK